MKHRFRKWTACNLHDMFATGGTMRNEMTEGFVSCDSRLANPSCIINRVLELLPSKNA
jgi:hypothetical protein